MTNATYDLQTQLALKNAFTASVRAYVPKLLDTFNVMIMRPHIIRNLPDDVLGQPLSLTVREFAPLLDHVAKNLDAQSKHFKWSFKHIERISYLKESSRPAFEIDNDHIQYQFSISRQAPSFLFLRERKEKIIAFSDHHKGEDLINMRYGVSAIVKGKETDSRGSSGDQKDIVNVIGLTACWLKRRARYTPGRVVKALLDYDPTLT